jgi:hypothetical protein
LKVRGSLEVANTLSRSAFLRKYEQKFAESVKPVKIFYNGNSLFIGAMGGAVSRTRLDSTVARFQEDACPLRRSEGDVFTEILRFRGIG